jgi:hypothetical protein
VLPRFQFVTDKESARLLDMVADAVRPEVQVVVIKLNRYRCTMIPNNNPFRTDKVQVVLPAAVEL